MSHTGVLCVDGSAEALSPGFIQAIVAEGLSVALAHFDLQLSCAEFNQSLLRGSSSFGRHQSSDGIQIGFSRLEGRLVSKMASIFSCILLSVRFEFEDFGPQF